MPECKWCCEEMCTNDESPLIADYCPVPDTPGICWFEEGVDKVVEQTAQKGDFCPLMVSGGNMHINGRCIGTDCAWFCGFARSCSIPLLAGMFADSEICRNVFEKAGEQA